MAYGATTQTPAEELADNLKALRTRSRVDREASEQLNRQTLRDSVVQLREPSPRVASGPAVASQPSFKLGPVPNFPYVSERGATPNNGNMSEKAATEFFDILKDASTKRDASSRDQAVGRAANVAATDWAQQRGLLGGKEGVVAAVLHEARAQAAFVAREIGHRIGVGPVESSIIGYSLERALERQGFKVFASHAIDKTADVFKATASSVSQASGLRHSAEQTLTQSMNWLASHGVTREALKEAVSKHAGKLLVVAEISQHPEVVQRVAHTLAKSDKVLDGALLLAKDSEFRKAVGTLAVSAGETVAGVHKGAGSMAIVAGSMLRGDTTEETGRHAFRAALTVLGGAAGGVVGVGFASVATGTAGAVAGSWAADKLLSLYDKHLGNGPTNQAEPAVAKQEVRDSAALVAHRLADPLKADAKEALGAQLPPSMADRMPALASRVKDMEREYTMHRPNPAASNTAG